MAESTQEEFSVLLYDALNHQGFSKERIHKRTRNADEYCNTVHRYICTVFDIDVDASTCIEYIAAGSKGEGVALGGGSDQDFMIKLNFVMCVDQWQEMEESFVLQNEYSKTTPGYVRLLARIDFNEEDEVNMVLQNVTRRCSFSWNNYLSSCLFSQHITNFMQTFSNNVLPLYGFDEFQLMLNGPALTTMYIATLQCESGNVLEYKQETDLVLGLPFYSHEVMAKWLKRRRNYEWPSTHLQTDISKLEGVVVPVGDKLSYESDIEWRLSYTTAEKKLVHSMDDVQVKLYVVLKYVQKDRLKPSCKNFTSYIVKNLVFWMLEMTPITAFTPNKLMDIIMAALRLLRRYLKLLFLPCYMIPERNLFHGRMTQCDCKRLLRDVENIIEEGPMFLLNNHFVSLSMQLTYNYPDTAREYEQWVAEIEDLKPKLDQISIKLTIAVMFNLDLKTIFDEDSVTTLIRFCKLLCRDQPVHELLLRNDAPKIILQRVNTLCRALPM